MTTENNANFVVAQRYDPTKDGGYYMLAIESSYGNGYAFAWSHPGTSFYRFLGRCDQWYLASKLCMGESKIADWEATTDALRKSICTMRRNDFCTAAEAREAWPESHFESESDFSEWARNQELLHDLHEEIVLVPGRRCQGFMALHKAFWADFTRQLLAAEDAAA